MTSLQCLLKEVRDCRVCEAVLPLGPRPVVVASTEARLMIIGQAPGTRVHATGIPWNDPSGDRLRLWLQLGREQFYEDPRIAIMPMGFCYPGKGKSGDLPPRAECAPLWHERLLNMMPNIELVLLIGQYAQAYYLNDDHKTLAERVQAYSQPQRMPGERYLPLPHPSPRNRRWLSQNPWFESQTVPLLQERIANLLF